MRYAINGILRQELLKGKIYFQDRQRIFFKHDIDIQNILSCATGAAPDITGKYIGFIGLLKKDCPVTLAIHCVVLGQHLTECVNDELNVFFAVCHQSNKHNIKSKQQASNNRMFRELCKDNDDDFEPLVMHTEVRWLSKGNCLIHFLNIF